MKYLNSIYKIAATHICKTWKYSNLRLFQRDFYVEIIVWRHLNMAELDVGKHCEIKSYINVIQTVETFKYVNNSVSTVFIYTNSHCKHSVNHTCECDVSQQHSSSRLLSY